MDQKFCEPCQSDDLSCTAVKWCVDCEEALCNDCERAHRKSKASKMHKLIDVLSGTSLPRVKVQDCKLHPDQKVDLFCIDHDALCCRICMTENHRNCLKVITIEMASKNVGSSAMLAHILEQAGALRQCLADLLKSSQDEKCDIDRQKKEVCDQISSYKNHLIDLLNESEKSLLSHVDQIFESRQQTILTQENTFSEQESRLQQWLEALHTLSDNGSNEQLFLFAQQLKSLLIDSESVLDAPNMVVTRECIKFEANKSLVCADDMLGKIKVISEKSTTKPLSLPRQVAQACGAVSDDGLNLETKNSKTRLVFSSKFKNAYGVLNIRGIAVMKDGRILVCDHKNTFVLRFSAQGQFIDRCNVERQPWNIVVLEETQQAVVSLTGNLKLASLISVAGHLMFMDIKSMTRIRELRLDYVPLGLTIVGQNFAVGTWNMIQIFDKDGKFLREICLERRRFAVTYLLHDNRDYFYYSTSEFCGITQDGKNIINFPYISGRPRGICSDKEGFVYVCSNEGELLKFSPEGKLCDTLIEGYDDYGPLWAIAFNNDYTQLYVATDNGKYLSVFDIK